MLRFFLTTGLERSSEGVSAGVQMDEAWGRAHIDDDPQPFSFSCLRVSIAIDDEGPELPRPRNNHIKRRGTAVEDLDDGLRRPAPARNL